MTESERATNILDIMSEHLSNSKTASDKLAEAINDFGILSMNLEVDPKILDAARDNIHTYLDVVLDVKYKYVRSILELNKTQK